MTSLSSSDFSLSFKSTTITNRKIDKVHVNAFSGLFINNITFDGVSINRFRTLGQESFQFYFLEFCDNKQEYFWFFLKSDGLPEPNVNVNVLSHKSERFSLSKRLISMHTTEPYKPDTHQGTLMVQRVKQVCKDWWNLSFTKIIKWKWKRKIHKWQKSLCTWMIFCFEWSSFILLCWFFCTGIIFFHPSVPILLHLNYLLSSFCFVLSDFCHLCILIDRLQFQDLRSISCLFWVKKN